MPQCRVRLEPRAEGGAHVRLEARVLQVVDVELRMALHALCALQDARDIRLARKQHELRRAPVAEGVEAPGVEAPQDEVIVVRGEIRLPELLLKVPDGELHPSVGGYGSFVPVGMERAVGDVRHDARHVEPNREEEVPLGRDEPPPAVYPLHAEVSRRRERGALRPAAEAVPGIRRGTQARPLRFEVVPQLRVRRDLEAPADMGKLPVAVDEGKVLFGRDEARGVRFALHAQVREAQVGEVHPLVLERPLHLEGDFGDVRRVEDGGTARGRRGAVDTGVDEQEAHRPLLAGVEPDTRVGAALPLQDRRRVVARIPARIGGGDVEREARRTGG